MILLVGTPIRLRSPAKRLTQIGPFDEPERGGCRLPGDSQTLFLQPVGRSLSYHSVDQPNTITNTIINPMLKITKHG